ncbi:hypothetical protein ATK30_6837 [Amycolatopsis echigonensis]|uniref:Uncharacterized protein n=1 Tax=Amycolatopsis echigonensis TaxID=2576905 RepID=A0A2N3WPV9_9PSEU|nr:hypothetical protein [Amycolatopsis niigatensis]PKV95904.1 hypothetical protein ATK30_6837 [Amycolatopsis niigatensis]
MRIRSIRPEFWRSDDINQLSREVRLLFIGLWSYVDDNGVGVDDHRQIAADLFPLDDDPREVREFVREGLATLSRVLLLTRFEHDSRSYIFIPTWDKHQKIDRPGKPRYPRPGEPAASGNVEARSEKDSNSRQDRETIATGEGEKGRRGKEKTSSNRRSDGASADSKFDEFWSAYPRREAKRGAHTKFAKAVKDGTPAEEIIAGAKRYAAYLARVGREREKIKIPTTWLNNGCWDDELGGEQAAPVAGTDPVAWLRGLWQAADVAPIERATHLRYERPDLPVGIDGKQAVADFFRDHRRAWIDQHRPEILAQLTKDAA